MMRLSESLRKNIMEATIGRVLNKFKGRSRRDILFFEDILANYIKECEDVGFGKEMKKIGQEWMYLTSNALLPESLKALPCAILFNRVLKKVWINLGLLKDIKASKKNKIIILKTKGEMITRIIGANNAIIGVYIGILNRVLNTKIGCIKARQTRELCEYVFQIKDLPVFFKMKEKIVYDELNLMPRISGFTLKDALKKRILQLGNENKIYFRKKILSPIENTIFHIIGNYNILLEQIFHISYDFFKNLVENETVDEKKLILLKNLLQVTGWGIIRIKKDKRKILFEIKTPPYGLQLEKDNWKFLANMILGFLWTIDKKFRINSLSESYKNVKIAYSR